MTLIEIIAVVAITVVAIKAIRLLALIACRMSKTLHASLIEKLQTRVNDERQEYERIHKTKQYR
jgi:CO/xanthine dehydrogenase FAD-binding subunit